MQPIFANRMFESGVGIRSNFFNQRDTSFLGQAVEMTTPIQRVKQGPDNMPGVIPTEPRKIMPQPQPRPGIEERPVYSADRFQKLLLRLCSMMTRFATDGIDAEIQGRFFWSYIQHANQPEALVLSTFKELCPAVQIPPKPTTPAKELKQEPPEKQGFHGKAQISYAEAKELLAALDEVLRPLTPEEVASDIGKEECLRDLAAGNFPIVENLRDRLANFIAAGDTGATFEISHGEMNVTGKAVDCAVALGRGKVIKTALTAGGAIGAGALLLLLL